MVKHEWRKKEKDLYIPKNQPEFIHIPDFQFLTIEGEGNPGSPFFQECIEALYTMAYAIKMTPKKMDPPPTGYYDYTVYPLEGIWDLNEEGRKNYNGTSINKDDLVFKLMLRQPDFVSESFFKEMLEGAKKKKALKLLEKVKFESILEGDCVQMLHVGSFDNEPESFRIMEEFATSQNLERVSKVHREIYLSDFRKVSEDKLKTVLRFNVKK